MDAGFVQKQRRGFSTFEPTLRMSGALPLDAAYLVKTGIGHRGNSSLRMIHRRTDPRRGPEVGRPASLASISISTRVAPPVGLTISAAGLQHWSYRLGEAQRLLCVGAAQRMGQALGHSRGDIRPWRHQQRSQ